MTYSLDSAEFLPALANPRWAVFVDFDETYLAHEMTPERERALRRLEDFLARESRPRSFVFGWITGSTRESLSDKVARYRLRVVPHFVASSVGSELELFTREHGRTSCAAWERGIAGSGYDKQRVPEVLAALRDRGVELLRQKQRSPLVDSYYYYARDPERDRVAVDEIRAAAQAHRFGVNVSPCNPGAGDPEGAYDVDLYPTVCGKVNAVQFLTRYYGVDPAATLAFGDSVGDLGMLQHVARGFLVANARPEAKERFARVVEASYAAGILEQLAALLPMTSAPADPAIDG